MYLLSIFTAFILCSKFYDYNVGSVDEENTHCPDSELFIQMAADEEDKLENNDKIILYHGESVGLWLTQLLWKFYFYPEAAEDWLPLRLKIIRNGFHIDKTLILKMINQETCDHNPNIRQFALSVSPNMVSNDHAESAWSWACNNLFYDWDRVKGGGLKDNNPWIDFLFSHVRSDLRWHFIYQWEFIKAFVQYRRNYNVKFSYYELDQKFSELFPNTYFRFPEYQSVFEKMAKVKESPQDHELYHEGVFLQIIMDKETADELCYNAHPFGYLKSNKLCKFKKPQNVFEDGDLIEPYSEVYHEVKNQKDFSQARIILTNDFRRWPSSIKIKAIAGLMKDENDYIFLKALIQEMAQMNEPVNPKSKLMGYRKKW